MNHTDILFRFWTSLIVIHRIRDTLILDGCKHALKLFKYLCHMELQFTKCHGHFFKLHQVINVSVQCLLYKED